MSGTWNVEVVQGAGWSRTLVVTDEAGTVDLSGYSARMQVRTVQTAPTAVLELSTANGRITIDGEAGTITLELLEEETSGLTAEDSGVHDLFLYPVDGEPWRLLRGRFAVAGAVTRPDPVG